MSPDPSRTQKIVDAALRITDPTERSAFLDRECDAEMRVNVNTLLDKLERVKTPPLSGQQETVGFTPAPEPGTTALHRVEDATSDFPSKPRATDNARTAAARSASAIGTVIGGKYRITGTIGEGGMGSVYLAQQSEPVKREVALKLIKSGADSKTVVARFEAERQALALMDHPNIARVYDGGTTATGQPFFVMELVRGMPITTFSDENRLSPKNRLELFVQVCRAVQHAHQKGIIHRDLKPGNILVTVVDGRPTPKVIDFGVAKAVDQRLTDSNFSEEGVVVGTPTYMSPEQADPSVVDIDTRTDVYALGIVLYELLAGLPPIAPKEFRRAAILEMMRMVREVEPEHLSTKASSAEALPNIAASRGLEPSQLLSFLRGDVDWIVLKALEKDRERRYESADGMAADILRCLANEPVIARPPNLAYRLRKFVRRHRGAVLAASLIVLALVAGVIGIVWQWREAVFQRTQADIARNDAENNFRIAQAQRKVALDAVGQMVTKVRTELLRKPDLQGVLKNVLQIVQKSLDNIAQNPLVDISLNDTTRAAAHDATARLYRDLGETESAKKEFNKAIDIYQAILNKAAEGPDKETVRDNLVISLLALGQTSFLTSSQADVRTIFDRAAQLVDELSPKLLANRRRSLAYVYGSLGTVTIDKSPRDAQALFLKALGITESIADDEAKEGQKSFDTQVTLVNTHLLVGSAADRRRDAKLCEEHQRKALAIATALVAANPGEPNRKSLEASIHSRIGDLLLRTNRAAEAVKQFTSTVKLYKDMADADPKNVIAQESYARNLYSLGLAALRAGDKDAATQHFQASLKHRQARANWRDELDAVRNMMMSLARVGSHQAATELAEVVRAKLSKDPGALVDIACCYAVASTVAPAADANNEARDGYVAKAIEALKQAIATGYGDKVNLETEPDLDALRNHAEFMAMLKKLPEP